MCNMGAGQHCILTFETYQLVLNMQCDVQSTRKGNAAVQGMQHVAGQRCTPFAEACRGVTASSHRTAQGASVMLEPFTMLHVRPLQNGQDTVEAGVDRLFERNVDDVSGSHQTLILEAPQVRSTSNSLLIVTYIMQSLLFNGLYKMEAVGYIPLWNSSADVVCFTSWCYVVPNVECGAAGASHTGRSVHV